MIKVICEKGATVGELRPSVAPQHVVSPRKEESLHGREGKMARQ